MCVVYVQIKDKPTTPHQLEVDSSSVDLALHAEVNVWLIVFVFVVSLDQLSP